MDGFMTTSRPAGSLAQTRRVIHAADVNGRTVLDLLEMALQTQVCVAFGEHFGVHAAVRRVATGAAFAHGLVFEHIHPALRLMTLLAVFLLREQLRAAAGVGNSLVRRMA